MIIVVINNKGGTGKTTTSVNLSAALANAGNRVLLIDLDPQAATSLSLGVNCSDLSPSAADVLFDGSAIENVIRNTNIQRLDLLTGDIELANSDIILADVLGRENILAESLKPVKNKYDYIICDCASSLSLLPINALVAADGYIVPITADYLALEVLFNLNENIEKIKKSMDINVELLGIVFTMINPSLFTMFNQELKNQLEIINLVKTQYGKAVFETVIKRDVRLSEAPSYGASIFEYNPETSGAKKYSMLAEEVIERCDSN